MVGYIAILFHPRITNIEMPKSNAIALGAAAALVAVHAVVYAVMVSRKKRKEQDE